MTAAESAAAAYTAEERSIGVAAAGVCTAASAVEAGTPVAAAAEGHMVPAAWVRIAAAAGQATTAA